MVLSRHRISIAAGCFLIAGTCMGQANLWNGSYKAVPHSMKYSGFPFSIEQQPDGYQLTTGGEKEPAMVCDESPHEVQGDAMATCVKTSDGYQVTRTHNGTKVSTVTLTVSSNGKKLTRKAEVFPPGAPPYTITSWAKRVSGGPGLSGTWKDDGFQESQDTGVLSINVHGDEIDFKETDQDKPITVKLDGTPLKEGNREVSIKLADPRTLKVTYSSDGKLARENTFVLSPDGKTVTETDVTPAPRPSTMTLTLKKM